MLNPMTSREAAEMVALADELDSKRHLDCFDEAPIFCTPRQRDLIVQALRTAARPDAGYAVKALEGISGLGCDARNGGPHSVMAQGTNYKFCTACGETIRAPALRERTRVAEARAETAERNLLDLTSLRNMLILCGELGGMRSGEKVPDFLRRIIDGLIDAERKLAEAREALKPLARLEVPKRPQGNAGAYSIYHNDIRAARAITGED